MGRYTFADTLTKSRSVTAVNPERTALIFGEQRVTYDELEERTSRLASGLARAGFQKGDRASVLLLNRIEYVEILYALAKLGGVIVPANYLFKPGEVQYLVEDSGSRWLFVEDALWDTVRPIRGELSDVTYISVGQTEPDSLAYEDIVTSGSPEGVDVDVDIDDTLLLQYTSGTTGFPKGAVHTHGTVMWNSFHQLADFGITSQDVYLCIPALCWAAGFHDFTLPVLWAGGTVVLNPSRGFDAVEACRTIERHGVTTSLLVPSVLRIVLGAPLEDFDLSSLRMIISGGEPVPVPVIEEWQRRVPTCDLVQVYGMTEFPSLMTFLEASQAVERRGSAGRASRITELRIVDDDDREVAPGEHGEIIIRSPATMIGYYNKAEATKATIRDGWLHTGDRGWVDADGFLYIGGRNKDMIISGGLNVYPAEIERVLERHPAVAECAVVGVPDDKMGELGEAHVVLRPDMTVTEDELLAHARADLANYKIPRRWVLTSEPLPRTASGKVQKFALRGE